MIIDGHAHACGKFLTAKGIIKHLNKNNIDKVVLVPGELNSSSEYSLPNIAVRFPTKNVVKITNGITKFVMNLTGKVKHIPAGNEFVYQLKTQTRDRIIQYLWVTQAVANVIDYLKDKYKAWGFNGVKLHQCWESFSINSEFFEEVALWAEWNKLPLFIHMYNDDDV